MTVVRAMENTLISPGANDVRKSIVKRTKKSRRCLEEHTLENEIISGKRKSRRGRPSQSTEFWLMIKASSELKLGTAEHSIESQKTPTISGEKMSPSASATASSSSSFTQCSPASSTAVALPSPATKNIHAEMWSAGVTNCSQLNFTRPQVCSIPADLSPRESSDNPAVSPPKAVKRKSWKVVVSHRESNERNDPETNDDVTIETEPSNRKRRSKLESKRNDESFVRNVHSAPSLDLGMKRQKVKEMNYINLPSGLSASPRHGEIRDVSSHQSSLAALDQGRNSRTPNKSSTPVSPNGLGGTNRALNFCISRVDLANESTNTLKEDGNKDRQSFSISTHRDSKTTTALALHPELQSVKNPKCTRSNATDQGLELSKEANHQKPPINFEVCLNLSSRCRSDASFGRPSLDIGHTKSGPEIGGPQFGGPTLGNFLSSSDRDKISTVSDGPEDLRIFAIDLSTSKVPLDLRRCP